MKFAPAGTALPLAREAERLRWAATFTPVPEVVGEGSDESGRWLVTKAMPGTSAIEWDAPTAVRAIATGLREMHERLPADGCPFDWSIESRLAASPQTHPQHRELSIDKPPIDRLVVCHGDACAPNTLIGADGKWIGNVDMAGLGVADRWADLAVASWSLSWNFGEGWEELFFDTYRIEPDPVRIAYYRLLWDLGE